MYVPRCKFAQDQLHNGVWAWAMSPVKYVQEEVRNCTFHLATNYGGRFELPEKAENPFKIDYNQSWMPVQN